MGFLRSRAIIHIAGAMLACQIAYMILIKCGVNSIWYAAIAGPLVGIGSEIYDIVTEHYYKNKTLKNITDFMSWGFGACVFLAVELLKRG